MGKSVAVSIGVRQAGNLVSLPGAVAGAKDFADWAGRNGFDPVIELTDEDKPLNAQMIYDELAPVILPGGVDRLFIFFSGHGVSLGATADYWLLSPPPSNPNLSAVNVVQTIRLAQRSGIEHVVILADHCRTAADKPRQGVLGQSILPDRNYQGPTPTDLDEFYAARMNDKSQEATDPELQEAFGIFTRVLMDALEGRNPAATKIVRNGTPRRAVTAHSLRDWIVRAVQITSERIPGAATQTPDPRPSSVPPKVLAWLGVDPNADVTVRAGGESPRPARARLFTSQSESDALTQAAEGALPLTHTVPVDSFIRIEVLDTPLTHRQSPSRHEVFRVSGSLTIDVTHEPDMTKSAEVPDTAMEAVGEDAEGNAFEAAPRRGIFRVVSRDPLTGTEQASYRELDAGESVPRPIDVAPSSLRAVDEARRFAAAEGRQAFETRVGLTFIGAKPEDVSMVPPDAGVFEENGLWHVRGSDSSTAVIDVGNDRFCATAMFEGFVGTVVVDPRGVSQIAYVPARGSRFEVRDVDPEEMRRVMALATVSASSGRFDLAAEHATDVAEKLRMYKHYNPTLGVLAAYAYDQAGRTDQIRDMLPYFEDMDQTIPYDIVMLADVDPTSLSVSVEPRFPMLTQGWAYLNRRKLTSPAMVAARDSLAPTLWATPLGDGGRALADALKKGDL